MIKFYSQKIKLYIFCKAIRAVSTRDSLVLQAVFSKIESCLNIRIEKAALKWRLYKSGLCLWVITWSSACIKPHQNGLIWHQTPRDLLRYLR